MFNADDFAKTLRPPEVMWQGKKYAGRLLSYLDALPLFEKWEEMKQKKARGILDPKDNVEFITMVCEAIDIPLRVLMSMPNPVMNETLQDFFQCLVQGAEASRTSGNNSQPVDSARLRETKTERSHLPG